SGRHCGRGNSGDNGGYIDRTYEGWKKTMTTKGLEGVVANTTRLSDVIGDKGQLIYCGYDINELAGKVSYEEVVYLLWNNKLPNRSELGPCGKKLRSARKLPDGLVEFIKTAPKNA